VTDNDAARPELGAGGVVVGAAGSRPAAGTLQVGGSGHQRGRRKEATVKAFIENAADLRFDDGSPVRSASAIARFGDGWLVAQDDATHAAWRRPAGVCAVRVLDAVEGHEVFSAAEGTKHLKPDFEAACEVMVDGTAGVVLLGSGSTPARMRASLVRPGRFDVVALDPLYLRVADALGIDASLLNLEGACRIGTTFRWFNRGNLIAGLPSASVDLPVADLVAALTGARAPEDVAVTDRKTYDLGEVDGVGLAVTDAVALPDGRVLLSAAAEDTPNAVDDGPVVAAALALVHGDDPVDVAQLSAADGTVYKIEGLALGDIRGDGVSLVAVVDADDPLVPSLELAVRVDW
jgi:hypothetical protein